MRLTRLALLAVALVAVAAPASAQESAERVSAFTFAVEIEDDGDLLVVERITYDFGSNDRHGIFRDIPTRLRYDDRYDRLYRLHDVEVSSETAPDEVQREDGPSGTTRLRIGDPDAFVTGRHTYRIAYRIEGALNRFDDHVELYWNAIGTSWEVPIEQVMATVSAPVGIERAACFTGPEGSTLPCEESAIDGTRVVHRETRLEPFEAMTFVAGLPPGSVTATGPILEERWALHRAFSMTRGTVTATAAVLALAIAGVSALVWRVGRDWRAIGSAVDVAFAGDPDEEERVPLRGYQAPVQVEPPDGLRPGQVGTLIDERANALDVTATIVDLAVRGYLRIEEIPKEGWFGKPDWRLVKLRNADDALHEYEELLMEGIFNGSDAVELSDLKNRFAARLRTIQSALYRDAMERGWFRADPRGVRTRWILTGMAIAGAGLALTIAAAVYTRLALVPVPIILAGLALLLLAGKMPHRTPAGTGVLLRTLGFKQFIDESERDRARFAEQQHLFTEYLPYAIVFGATERWARAFAGLDGELPDQSSWYVGSHTFGAGAFSESMDGFATTAAGTIASTPSGSGTSGFGGGGSSGGGGGGGGGGSW